MKKNSKKKGKQFEDLTKTQKVWFFIGMIIILLGSCYVGFKLGQLIFGITG